MTEQEVEAGLLVDLNLLCRRGSGEEILDICGTVVSLEPIRLAIRGGALSHVAALALLVAAAKNAPASHRKNTISAVALTGIEPRHTGKGIAGDVGGKERQENAAKSTGHISTRAFRGKQRPKYLRPYVTAILEYVEELKRDTDQMVDYLRQCRVSDTAIAELTGAAPAQNVIPTVPTPTQPTLLTTSLIAHLVSLSGQVRQALDAARDSCQVRRRAFYTFDLLRALLDIPGGRVQECFEEVQEGLAQSVREQLREMPAPGKTQHLFEPFEWTERPDVQLAWQYTLQDQALAVTDIHLLLAVLDGTSETNGWLQRFLEQDYARVRAIGERLRREGPRVVKSPAPD